MLPNLQIFHKYIIFHYQQKGVAIQMKWLCRPDLAHRL